MIGNEDITSQQAKIDEKSPLLMMDQDPQITANNIIQLANSTPFGVGGRRACYVHPEDASKCIKVLRQDAQRTVRIQKKGNLFPRSWRREYDNNAHEEKLLSRIHAQIGSKMASHLPMCYGFVSTDLGKGLVLDLIRDHDGKISRSLREWITLGIDLESIKPAFMDLGNFLIEHSILTRHILDHNLALSLGKSGGRTFYLIDGIGDAAWLPLAQWFRTLGRLKIKRKLDAAWPRFKAFATNGGVTDQLKENSSWGQGILQHRD